MEICENNKVRLKLELLKSLEINDKPKVFKNGLNWFKCNIIII